MATPTNTKTQPIRGSAVRAVRAMRGVAQRIPRMPTHAASTLGGRRAQPQTTVVSRTTHTNLALAGLQLVIGYQWLISGGDKLLLGTFPTQMGHLLAGQIGGGKLPTYFAALLQALVVPNAPAFGYAIMLGEALAGLGLVSAGLLALMRPLAEAHISGRFWAIFARTDRLVTTMAPLAAVGAGLLGLSYYLLDGAPPLWFTPSLAYGGAIAPGMVVALASIVLVVGQVFRKPKSQ